MKISDRTKTKLLYFSLLIVGFYCPVLVKISGFSWISAITTPVWLYVFLDLLCRWTGKKEILLTGAVFIVSYCLMFAGALGNSLIGILPFAAFALGIFAAFFVSARIMVRWNRLPVTLVFPVVWLCLYLIATLLHFPSLARIDVMFADLTVLLQSERLIGSAGLSFAVVWIVSLLRFAVANRKPWTAGIGGGLFILLLLPGLITLYPNVQAAESVRIAYTTGPYIGDFLNYTNASYDVNLESMERSVRSAAEQDAEILIFSEEAFSVNDSDEERFLARCSALAKENNIAVLVGLDVADTDDSEGGKGANKAVLIDNDGKILGSYQKSRLIPILESDYASGDGSIPSYCLNLGGREVKISFLICYDSNFPGYVSKIDSDTDLLFLPSWDWAAVTELHENLCRTLAAENQVFILKATYDGLSAAIAPDGQIIQESDTDTTGYEQIQIVDMPVKSTCETAERTGSLSPLLYAVVGTEIMSALLCLMLLIVDKAKNEAKTKRSGWFTALVATEMTGCFADAVSWLLDGASRMVSILYVSTELSMILTFTLIGLFSFYLTEYIKERKQISRLPVAVSWIFVGGAVILTIVTSITGDMFVFENGCYTEGLLYPVYVILNAMSMIVGLIVVFVYRRSLSRTDRAIAYIYMILPVVMAVINLWIEDWSFAYPAVMFSLILIYVTLQSDRMKQLEQQRKIITFHATHDELTGLLNRRAFNDQVELLERTDGNSGLIFSDVNGLKYTNDRLGHEAGDRLLIRYAKMLGGVFRTSDLYRISGDEFICLMQNVTESDFEKHVQTLKTALQQDKPPLACIGAAYGSNQEIEELMNRAEALMYADKNVVHEQYPEIKR